MIRTITNLCQRRVKTLDQRVGYWDVVKALKGFKAENVSHLQAELWRRDLDSRRIIAQIKSYNMPISNVLKFMEDYFETFGGPSDCIRWRGHHEVYENRWDYQRHYLDLIGRRENYINEDIRTAEGSTIIERPFAKLFVSFGYR